MVQIATYVFFDTETTGLPWQERNQTKIIEASFLAVSRKDLMKTPYGSLPTLSKLTFLLNPRRPIDPFVTGLTGLNNNMLKDSPEFKDKIRSIYKFLDNLPKPVCLVAHNGDLFDFKILLAECRDIKESLPEDLLCADSLVGFRKLLKGTTIDHEDLNPVYLDSELLTDDEDSENCSEETDDSDELYSSLSDASCVSSDNISSQETNNKVPELVQKRDSVIKCVFAKKSQNVGYNCFKLGVLHQRLLNKVEVNAHRTEADCVMLLECVVALKDQFLPWADNTCKPLTDIKPLVRNFKKSSRY